MKPKLSSLLAAAAAAALTLAGAHVAVAQTPTAKTDSAQINQLLSEAKTEAAMLQKDSEELVTFQRQNISWQSHSEQLESMRQHANAIGKLETQLRDARATGSDWQQEAIDRVNPPLRELADNLTATIKYATDNQTRLRLPEFGELVQANSEMSGDLYQIIAVSVDYGQKKSAFEAAENKFIEQGDR